MLILEIFGKIRGEIWDKIGIYTKLETNLEEIGKDERVLKEKIATRGGAWLHQIAGAKNKKSNMKG